MPERIPIEGSSRDAICDPEDHSYLSRFKWSLRDDGNPVTQVDPTDVVGQALSDMVVDGTPGKLGECTMASLGIGKSRSLFVQPLK